MLVTDSVKTSKGCLRYGSSGSLVATSTICQWRERERGRERERKRRRESPVLWDPVGKKQREREREREGPPRRERGRARSDTTAADGLPELGASCWLEMRLPSSVSYIAPLSLPQRAAA